MWERGEIGEHTSLCLEVGKREEIEMHTLLCLEVGNERNMEVHITMLGSGKGEK
jgi:hypothetical protein